MSWKIVKIKKVVGKAFKFYRISDRKVKIKKVWRKDVKIAENNRKNR